MVPQVSAISSTRMAIFSLTSPTRTMDATSLTFLRSLCISANSTLRRSAIEVTLGSRMLSKGGEAECEAGKLLRVRSNLNDAESEVN